ncbi:hypothetical protein LDL08_22320 [Nonomuraea glycinis]|uniref:hypothetical protein n=1 Tax=Nonomuraea glycinis TaxID=2047744 RepID=UPI00166D2851|nr:hypothetical protein [Nonomuraea glycinis]MCA2178929.1 hypothetical protein [Nonomuraea glycinis]
MIAYGGLAPALRLAERAGLERLAGEYVALSAAEGANAAAKVTTIVAGMACGADDIDDLDRCDLQVDRLFTAGVNHRSTVRPTRHASSELLGSTSGRWPIGVGSGGSTFFPCFSLTYRHSFDT